jgi:hypothetical protein
VHKSAEFRLASYSLSSSGSFFPNLSSLQTDRPTEEDRCSQQLHATTRNNKLSLLMHKQHHQTKSCSQLKHHNKNNNKKKAITAKENPTQQVCCYEKEKMDCKALDLRSLRAELSFSFS